MHGDCLVKGERRLDIEDLIALGCGCSVARVHGDVFLVSDKNTELWALVRIATP